ncbi:hypothetical protein LCGC14_2925770 [marine sediment metagenome]|uniref:Uncharacterized protein n=1 Tax=marine sediment metagenome TaxID=412755 RepID=A0A0F9ADG2_9ZZZZ
MTAAAVDDAWMETCLISISKAGGSDLQAAGETETVDFDIGEKDIEGLPLANGGRMTKWTPEGDSTITFEAYPLEAGTDTGTTLKGFYDLMHTVDASVPIRITNDRNRDKYRVLVLWTNDPTPTTAQATTNNTFSAFRIGLADGYFTSVKPNFTDGDLKFTVMYKVAAFDKSAGGNVMMESCAGTTAGDILPAIAAYNTSNKFG